MTTIQSQFAAALLRPDAPVPPGWCAHNGSDPSVRFDVYRNNVVASLVAALADGFPVTCRMVGDAFFGAMARAFVMAHPPASPVLAEHGDAFADFIEGFAPVACVPYLADMARLERARVRACHAADAMPLSRDELAARTSDPGALPGARLQLHPSVQVVRSRFAIVSLWAAHHGEGAIERVDPEVPEAALVLRVEEDVVVQRVPLATAHLIRRLCDGATLGAAAAAAGDDATLHREPFDLATSLALLIHHQTLTAWQAGEPS